MSQLKLRRGSTVSHAGFTGADGEITFNTDTNALVTHDGATAGGFPHAKASDLAASSGASLVGANAYQTQDDVNRERVSVKRFGAVGDGVTDDTVAIQTAYNHCSLVGGTLYFPLGVYSVTNITKVITAAGTSVNIAGDGMRNSVIVKRGTSTAAVFDISSPLSILELRQTVSGISIYGNYAASYHAGFKYTNAAYCTFDNVEVLGCGDGILAVGTLVSAFNNCFIKQNFNGYRFLKSADNVYCNNVTINGGTVSINSNHGIEFQEGTGLALNSIDIESNGTSGDVATGGVYIGAGVIAEIGLSIVAVSNCWFEANQGWAFATHSSAPVGNISLKDTLFFNSESGRAINIPLAKQIRIDNVLAPGATDTAIIYGDDCVITSSIINVLNDTSARKSYLGVLNLAGPVNRVSAKNAASAWVRFAGNGAVGFQTIVDSYNVSTVSKTATGTYLVTLTSAMANTNYAVIMGGQSGLTDAFFGFASTTSDISVETYVAGVLADKANISVMVFGT